MGGMGQRNHALDVGIWHHLANIIEQSMPGMLTGMQCGLSLPLLQQLVITVSANI